MNDKRFSIRMPMELYEKIEKEAKEKNIPIASVIKIIISEHYKKK